jgi:hypothetical protein
MLRNIGSFLRDLYFNQYVDTNSSKTNLIKLFIFNKD